jgi:hypothetical protein
MFIDRYILKKTCVYLYSNIFFFNIDSQKLEEKTRLSETNSRIKENFELYTNLYGLLSNKAKLPATLQSLLTLANETSQTSIKPDSVSHKSSLSSRKSAKKFAASSNGEKQSPGVKKQTPGRKKLNKSIEELEKNSAGLNLDAE